MKRPVQPLGIWSRLAIEFPQLNVPVLDRRWSCVAASGIPSRVTGNRDLSWAFDVPIGWKQRLLGPLAARADERSFAVFSADDWSRIVGALGSTVGARRTPRPFFSCLASRLLAAGSGSGRPVLTWREGLPGMSSVPARNEKPRRSGSMRLGSPTKDSDWKR